MILKEGSVVLRVHLQITSCISPRDAAQKHPLSQWFETPEHPRRFGTITSHSLQNVVANRRSPKTRQQTFDGSSQTFARQYPQAAIWGAGHRSPERDCLGQFGATHCYVVDSAPFKKNKAVTPGLPIVSARISSSTADAV